MRSRTPQIVAFLSLAGCASVAPPPTAPKPDASVAVPASARPAQPAAIASEPSPPPASVQPPTPLQTSPPVQPSSPVRTPPAPAAAPTASAPKPKPQPVAPQTKPVAAPASAPAPASQQAAAAPPTLDLASLEQRLRDTKAIGVFTKLSLKNQVDDLLADFRALYKKAKPPPGPEFRQRYDLLLLKVLSLLQDGDPPLASAIASSKEAIWSILSDPDKLAKI
jgi:hypothetical protein